MSEQNPIPDLHLLLRTFYNNDPQQDTQLEAVQSANQLEQCTPSQPVDHPQRQEAVDRPHQQAAAVNLRRSVHSAMIFHPRRIGPNNKRYLIIPNKSHLRRVIASSRLMDEMEVEAIEETIKRLANIAVKQLATKLGDGRAIYATSWTDIDDSPKDAALKTGVAFSDCENEWCARHVLSEHWDNKHFYRHGGRAPQQNGEPGDERASDGTSLDQDDGTSGLIIANRAADTARDIPSSEMPDQSLSAIPEAATIQEEMPEQQASASSHVSTHQPVCSLVSTPAQ
ncbi:hypothetical protein BJV82DRAFT_674815 [Fennellomyces sp. T-0311]|nr:hypothetical protein BJV82DRAFT_674815 [Fennellomyces sp. T-0311]